MTYRIKIKELVTAAVISNAVMAAAFILAGTTMLTQFIENTYYLPVTVAGTAATPETALVAMKMMTYAGLAMMFFVAAALNRPRWKRWKK